MILTCPECATSYFVDDSRIPDRGRTVKCTSCGARWTAYREGARPEPEVAPPEPEPTPAVEVDAADDLEFVEAEAPPVAPEPVWAKKSRSARKEAKSKVAVWAAAAVITVAVVAGAIVFRGQIVRLWPNSSTAYAHLGLPVNNLGLVIEEVKVAPTFQGGRPVLSITGSIRNIKDEAVTSPALRINLLNRAGKPVAAKIAHPIDPRLPPRAVRHFAIAIADPPSNARDLEVVFDQTPTQTAVTPPPPPLTQEPVDAQPLPPGSPDALPGHG